MRSTIASILAIIGAKGRAVHKIMEEYKVEIRFPGQDAEDKDIVTISGAEDNVLDCKDHLLNVAEEYVSDSFNWVS